MESLSMVFSRVLREPAARTLGVLVLLTALCVQLFPQSGGTQLGQGFHLPRHGLEEVVSQHGGEADRGSANNPNEEQYDNLAYPNTYVTYDRVQGALNAFNAIPHAVAAAAPGSWQEVGPYTPNVSSFLESAYTANPSRDSLDSGRITSLAIAPTCVPGNCRLWVGAAGGGVWRTNDALAASPTWVPSSQGMISNAIGSLLVDPFDPTGNTLYAGTGEPNGSGDSEAGVGLYKSTNGGQNWTLMPGSVSVAKDRSIGAIAIDPANRNHVFIGTAVARHGSSSVNGGRFTPPGAPTIGLYQSTNGGATFSLAFSLPQDSVNPTSPTGGDFFRGGVTKIQLNRTGLSAGQPTRVYASFFDYGVYRSDPADQGGDASYKQVFASAGGGIVANSSTSRTEFALAPNGSSLRVYVGDVGTDSAPTKTSPGNDLAAFYRVNNANVPASSLTSGGSNVGWTKLSSSTKGTPGYASYNFCQTQCSYDMWVASPPGQPNTVLIGGSMNYNEIFTANPPSDGRAVMRSTDAGVDFTDMTDDAQNPTLGLHPDQHNYAFDPNNPNIFWMGNDGGLFRNDGTFVDASGQCAGRGLSPVDQTDCEMWLASIPNLMYTDNNGLRTLQFQSLSINSQDPLNDIVGGTQDNGTWSLTGGAPATNTFESIFGDGGQSGVDVVNPNIRVHTYTGASPDVNFNDMNTQTWDWIGDPLQSEAASFYVPLITDPKVGGTMFIGLQHVWRTQDDGGSQAYLDSNCNEFYGTFAPGTTCGDWVPLGAHTLTGSFYGTDKSGSYVVATVRAPSDTSTLWTATRRGRLFISKNADAASAASVSFTRIDTSAQPTRFISGITVDPTNPNHAWVSFSGFNAYTPTTPGHMFSVLYNPTSQTASWTDLSGNLGDQPITGIARDDNTGTLYASTDFGVLMLRPGSPVWQIAGLGLPPVAVYGLTLSDSGRVLYAATHGRGAFRLNLP